MKSAEPAAGVTRGRLLRAGAVAAAGAVAIGSHRGDGASLAAAPRDTEILNFFLTLEHVQEAFYRQAADSGRLEGELLSLAKTVGAQETEHVRHLSRRLGEQAKPRPRAEFGPALESPEDFLRAAIELEETVLAGYVGQAANLGHREVGAIATIVSVEARQVAWLRDLDGVSPAPRAADPARKAGDVLDDLRAKGFLA
jgi:rubrerythrin